MKFSVFLIVSLHFTLKSVILAVPGDKSREKCKEYSKLVYTEEDSPVLTRRASKDKVSQCGIVEVPLVIGGVVANPKEFPHMAVIGYGNSPDDPNLSWRCGGTLISDNFVMTASHCLVDQGGSPQKIRVGEVNFLDDSESKIQDKDIKRIVKHPEYRTGKKYNDIALLELDSPVEFNAYVRPACLHVDHEVKEPRVVAAGFGKTSFDAADGSKLLMKVTLNVLPSRSCTQYFRKELSAGGSLHQGIAGGQLCAGELRGGKDTCQGDSGGPLQVALTQPYCMYSVVGIVSFGKFCGFANQPAIYTSVAHYVPWIEGVVWP